MDALLDVLVHAFLSVVVPAGYASVVLIQGFGIRHRLREGLTPRPLIRLLTAGIWTVLTIYGLAALGLPSSALRSGLLFGSLLSFFVLTFGAQRLEALLRRRNPRISAAVAVRSIYESMVDPTYGPSDEPRIRAAIAALDEWRSPATDEYIDASQTVARADLDGSEADRANEALARRRDDIARGWRPHPIWVGLARVGLAVRRPILATASPLELGAGIVAGLTYQDAPLVTYCAAVAWAYVTAWKGTARAIPLGLIGFAIGLLAWIGLQSAECALDCPWAARPSLIGVAITAIAVASVVEVQRRRYGAKIRSGPIRILD